MNKIGKIYALNISCLNNRPGTIGICFNEYGDFDKENETGVQVIFENGEYDGFSIKEQEEFLSEVGFEDKYSNYEFLNVMKVSNDFDNGLWNDVFKKYNLLD